MNSVETLLSFGDAVAKSKRSPEKLFVLLDMYEIMHELQPEVCQELFFWMLSKIHLSSSLNQVENLLLATSNSKFLLFCPVAYFLSCCKLSFWFCKIYFCFLPSVLQNLGRSRQEEDPIQLLSSTSLKADIVENIPLEEKHWTKPSWMQILYACLFMPMLIFRIWSKLEPVEIIVSSNLWPLIWDFD